MNKSEFVRAVAEKADLTLKQADAVYDAVYDVIVETLKKGDKVMLPGFLSFELKKREARTGINPATGEAIKIKASTVPTVKAGKTFKELF